MLRTIDLKKYLPNYIAKYREIDKIMDAEQPEFQIAADETEIILDNLFINTCNEKGLEHFEKMMGIYPLDGEDLEARRSRVLTRWYADLPYTYFFLIRKLNSLCGIDNYVLNLDNDKYELSITTHLTYAGQLEELFFLFENILPVNLVTNVRNEITVNDCNGDLKIGSAMTFCEVLGVSDALQIKTNGDIKIGCAITFCEVLEVSDTLQIKTSGNIKISGAMTFCDVVCASN